MRRGATAAKAAPKGASKKTASKKSKDVPKNKKIAAPTAPLDEETAEPEYTAQAASINDETNEQENAFLRDQTPEIREGTEEDMGLILENDTDLLGVDYLLETTPVPESLPPVREESPPRECEKSLVEQDGPTPPPPVEQDGLAPPPPVEQDGPAPPPPVEQDGPAPPPPVEQDGPAPPPPVEQEGPVPAPPVKQDVPPPPPPPPVGANVPPRSAPPPVGANVPPPSAPPPVGANVLPPSTPPPPPPLDEQENGGVPSTPAANPHAKSRGDPVLTLDGATWADCNAEAPKNPVQERIKAPLGEAEKASQKERRKQRAEEDEAYQIALANFDLEMDVKAEEIAEKFHKDVDDVQRVIRAVSFMAMDRAVNLQNAKMWKVRTEVNDPLPPGEKHLMRDLQKMVREDPRFQNMMDKDEEALIAVFKARPDKKVVGTCLSNAAVARDVTAFTKRIHHELCSLQKSTGAIGVCIIGRSSVSDMLLPACIGPEEGRQYFPQILRSTADQFALKFDHFTVNRGAAGLELGSNELRKAVADGISDGLEQRLGKKVIMKYGEYDQLVATHGVELLGWPEGTPFQSPSNLATVERLKPLHNVLQANTLRWEVMSDTRKAEHKAAMANKEKKQCKERRDKDLSREEAAKLREIPTNKRKNSKGSDDEGKQRPKRIKKAVMVKMTAEEKLEHKRKMERERKARNWCAQAEKEGKEIKKRKRGSRNDEGRGKAKKARTSVKSKPIIDDDDDEYELPSKKGKGKAKATPSEDEEEDEEDEESDPNNEKGSHTLPYSPRPSKQYLAVNAAILRGKKNKPPVARPRPRSPADPPVASTSQLPPQTLNAISNNNTDDEEEDGESSSM
ncbi:hypothetical protein B0H13DRAFT_2326281 [Mycena leptocephala]|nr:hypothetical protein B0H13DRAFT_2326281 [Mycena leptocephala]